MIRFAKTKIQVWLSARKMLALCALVLLIVAGMTHALAAQTVSEGYSSDQPLQQGMLVIIDPQNAKKVDAVTLDNQTLLHGVVVNANDAAVTLSNQGQSVFVATTGHFDVLVSSQNGPINVGDFVGVSAIQGVGMKANPSEQVIAGRALTAFDGKNNVLSTTSIKGAGGANQNVALGRILVDVGVARNPLAKPLNDNLPGFLEKASTTIAQKPVNAVRVYTGLVILVVSAAVCGSMLYAGIRSTMIAIGRNPLSKKSVVRSLIQVLLSGLIVFAIGLFGVYLILKL